MVMIHGVLSSHLDFGTKAQGEERHLMSVNDII